MKKKIQSLAFTMMKSFFRLWSVSSPRIKTDPSLINTKVVLPWTDGPYDISFGHAKGNSSGLQISYEKPGPRCLTATCTMQDDHANFPGATHGGLVACALDEVMGQTVFVDTGALAVSLEAHVEWLASTPIHQNLIITAQIIHKIGQFFLVASEIRCGQKICAKSSGLYFQPTAQMMAKMLRLKDLSLEAQQWFK